MSIGFIYAGQGSQRVGMGQDFYETYPSFQETFDQASEQAKKVTPMELKSLCFEGPMEQLSQTKYTQPAMVAFAVGVTKLLEEKGINPAFSCGLSLGEYSALYQAKVLDEEQVIDLVAKRGKYMEEAAAGQEVKMAAVLGMERDVVLDCCKKASEQSQGKLVQAANFNCPGQIVISGHAQAVDLASELLKEAGAKRVLPLKVSGPFHTKLMKAAGDALEKEFETIDFQEMKTKVLFNCLGGEKAEGDKISDLLVKQVQSSVYLEDSIRYMAEQGVDTIIEIGPGKAISKFVKKTCPEVNVMSIDSVADFEEVVKELGA